MRSIDLATPVIFGLLFSCNSTTFNMGQNSSSKETAPSSGSVEITEVGGEERDLDDAAVEPQVISGGFLVNCKWIDIAKGYGACRLEKDEKKVDENKIKVKWTAKTPSIEAVSVAWTSDSKYSYWSKRFEVLDTDVEKKKIEFGVEINSKDPDSPFIIPVKPEAVKKEDGPLGIAVKLISGSGNGRQGVDLNSELFSSACSVAEDDRPQDMAQLFIDEKSSYCIIEGSEVEASDGGIEKCYALEIHDTDALRYFYMAFTINPVKGRSIEAITELVKQKKCF